MFRTFVALLVMLGLAAFSATGALAESGSGRGLDAHHPIHLVVHSERGNADCCSEHHVHSASQSVCAAICAGFVGLVAFDPNDTDQIWLPSRHARLTDSYWVGRPPDLIDHPPKTRLT
ncbi:MAG: hypothetical protein RLO50_22100 [Azospirillaceae bacterium]